METGKHYNYFRDYDPSIGRYVESDPIGLKAGLNTYSYVGADPLSHADFKGRAYLIPAGGGYEGQPGMGAGNNSNAYAVPGLLNSFR